jgi:hypothetical protein
MQVNFNKPKFAVSSQPTQVRSEPSCTTLAAQEDRFSLSVREKIQQLPVAWTIAGAIPVVGMVTNSLGLLGAGANNKDGMQFVSLSGAAQNLMGTVSLTAGLWSGNQVATIVGLGMLAGSTATAGMVAYNLLGQ